MKTLIATIIILLLEEQLCFAQWYQQISGTSTGLNDLFFIDSNNGIVIGDSGVVLRTTNGGTNWSRVQIGVIKDLTAICFTDSANGWVIGNGQRFGVDSSIILRTNDSGQSWTIKLNYQGILTSISFINTSIGYAEGYSYDHFLLRTTDGGMNWQRLELDSLGSPLKLQFLDSNNGWMTWIFCSDNTNIESIKLGSPADYCTGGLRKTTDAGNSWSNSLNSLEPLSDFKFIDEYNGIALEPFVGSVWWSKYSGVIHKTTDGGESWSTDSMYSGVYRVFYLNSDTIVTLGGGYGGDTLFCSTDRGITWLHLPTGLPDFFNQIFFTDELTGWMIASNGIIYHTANSILPVEIASLTATSNGNEIELNWSTATEINNHGFEIQRSLDGDDFLTVGFIEGHGTTSNKHNYTFSDKKLESGKYSYRLKQIDYDGRYEYSEVVKVDFKFIRSYLLEQNFPNPFNPNTKIKYSLPQTSKVQIKVYDVLGNEITTLLNEEKPAGTYELTWNAASAAGGLPSGVYFYQLSAGDFVQTKKMILLK